MRAMVCIPVPRAFALQECSQQSTARKPHRGSDHATFILSSGDHPMFALVSLAKEANKLLL